MFTHSELRLFFPEPRVRVLFQLVVGEFCWLGRAARTIGSVYFYPARGNHLLNASEENSPSLPCALVVEIYLGGKRLFLRDYDGADGGDDSDAVASP